MYRTRAVGLRIGVVVMMFVAMSTGLVVTFANARVTGSQEQFATRGASLLGDPLVVASAESFVGGQQDAAIAARRANPQAVFARWRSRDAYLHMSGARAVSLARRSFPATVNAPAGGRPVLPAGARVLGYRSSHAVEVSLPNHLKGIVESSSEVAKRVGGRGFVPVSLALVRSSKGFAPAVSDAPARIPNQLANGVGLAGANVSLMPVSASGRTESSNAVPAGASVVYPNSGSATDTLVKPTLSGFQLDALLRSAASPSQLYFRVSAPAGSHLAQDRTGLVRVVRGHATLATIVPPAAEDAAETSVPASMRVSGHTLVVTVAHEAGSYLYPIEVDPEVNDTQLAKTTGGKRSNWEFHTSNGIRFAGTAVYEGVGKEHLETKGTAEYAATEWAYWGYETKGNSKIYELKAKTSAKNSGSHIESFLEFEASGGTEKPKKLLSTEGSEPEYSEKATTICAWNASKVEECLPAAGKEKNVARFQQSATAASAGKYGFSDTMSEGIVSISEPSGTHSKTSFDTTTPELEFETELEGKKVLVKRKNALYGSGVWLTKAAGALKMNSEDAGIGVATTKLEYENSPGAWTSLSRHEYLEKENACQGVQCYATHSEYAGLDPKLPDGEQKIRYRAEEAIPGTISLESEGKATVKVDTTAPHLLKLDGLPFGDEWGEKPYELTGEATDGEGSTVVSSGVKQLVLYIDGSQFGTAGGSCTAAKGECAATDKWTVNGAELGAGHHAIVLVATDNAGNEARLEKTISIRHSTPVSLGPGSVDLESGDFALSSTDVSMGSGLTVTRNYSSRATEAGDEGPLGPQWSLGLGTAESLSELLDSSVLLTDGSGHQTIFAKVGPGEYEPPVGDANLKLTLEENKTTKEKLAYYLEDTAKHTKTKFTRPSGVTNLWVPTKQEGTVATDTVTYNYQAAEAVSEYLVPAGNGIKSNLIVGPDKQIWYSDGGGEPSVPLISKMGTSGGPVANYTYSGSRYAVGLTNGPDGNIWFSEFYRIGKMSPTGTVLAQYTLPKNPIGITTGPDGNIWFGEPEYNEIGKITPSGTVTEYPLPASSPTGGMTAGPDGNLWFTEGDWHNPRIGKITPSGTITEYSLPHTESAPSEITVGPDNNLWYTFGHKIGKITTSGTITEYTLSSGFSNVFGITVGPDHNLWFTNPGQKSVGKITTSGAITEYTLTHAVSPRTIVTGPDGRLWFTETQYGRIGAITTAGVIVEPTEELAPVATGVSCTPMKAGCRALKFAYATFNEPLGEKQNSWGTFTGRLINVQLEAYEPVSKKLQQTTVAQYSYDRAGRLRAEWDPRISPALKTTYGYDAEGHITALNPAGEEPWTFAYGTSSSDEGTGRLLKVARPSASTALWNGEPAANTAVPTISGTPAVGVRLAASNGTWSNSPLSYEYRWIRCLAGSGCSTISGANNANYTPTTGDAGRTLIVVVSATNGGGSVEAASSPTAEVAGYKQAAVDSGNSVNAVACVPATTDCVISDSKGSAFYSTNVSSSSAATWHSWSGPGVSPSEAASCPSTSLCMLATGSHGGFGGDLYHAGSFGGAWTLSFSPSYGVDAISCPSSSFCVEGQDSQGFFRYSTNPGSTAWTTEQQGTAAMKGVSCLSSSFCVIVDSVGTARAATTIAQVESSGEWGSKKIDGTTALNGVACTSTTSCVAVDSAGNALKLAIVGEGTVTATTHNIDGTNSLTAVTCPSSSRCVAVDNKGNAFVSINAGETWTLEYQWADNLTSVSCPSTSLCVTTDTNGSVFAFIPREPGEGAGVVTPQTGFTMEYEIPLTGGSGLPTMTGSEVTKWGQSDDPVEATAIIPPDSAQSWPATSYTRATAYYLDESGRTVNVSVPSKATYGSVATTEYNEFNDIVRTLTPDNRQTALEAGAKSVEVSKLLDTISTYNGEGAHESEVEEAGTRLIDTLGPQHQVKYVEGSSQKESLARLHTKYFYDEGAPGGETYDLVTKTTTLAQLANEEEREVRKMTKSYSGQSNLGWKLRAPTSVTADPEGKNLTTTTIYNASTAQIAETRSPAGGAGGSPHDMKFIYYSAEPNTEGYSACGSHPEWAGLVCETLSAAQPTSGPKLPVTITTYNFWNEPLVITETFGTTTRTKTETYDAAGRLSTSETSSTVNTALPKLTNEFNSKTGMLEKQSTIVGGKTQTITSVYNALGQLTEYTDADGNITKYRYGAPENDLLLEEVADGSNSGTGKQTYSYDSTTKHLEELTDSAAGVFKASYDAEGRLTSEVYPNAMCADTIYNAVGEATQIEYIKTATCSEHSAPVWFSETRSPAVRGETFSRSSTLASETYSYDTTGRIIEAQETPAGEGCSTRLYGYDSESNRTSQTTRSPGVGGKCATEGGTVISHTYDEGNHLSDSGVSYDAFGNVAKVPAVDAEGHELSSTFYVDGAVASQSQNGVTNNYSLDPEGRVRETVAGANTTTTHYDSAGSAVAWTSETGGKSTRNIPGIDGSLTATQNNGAEAVLQLHDLEGDIVATASLSTLATKVLSSYNSTEFGVPNAEKAPPKFAWLGAAGIANSLSSGVITYGATSYVPQLGRSLQTEAVEAPGVAPHGTGAGVAYSAQEEPWVFQGAAQEGSEAPGLEAAREQAALEAAWAAATDPKERFYMNKTKARALAEKLWAAQTIGELASVFSIPADWIEAAVAIVSGVGDQTVFDWFKEAAGKMWKCGNNKWNIVGAQKVDICRIEYNVIHALGQTFVDFTSSAYVWECFEAGEDPCFHEVFVDKKESKCTLGIICVA